MERQKAVIEKSIKKQIAKYVWTCVIKISTALPCRLQGLEDTAVKICKDYGPDKIATLADKYRQVLNSPDINTCCYV